MDCVYTGSAYSYELFSTWDRLRNGGDMNSTGMYLMDN